jgi:hypothetical protein
VVDERGAWYQGLVLHMCLHGCFIDSRFHGI